MNVAHSIAIRRFYAASIIVVTVAFCLAGYAVSYSQSFTEEFREVEALQSKDTVFRIRRDGSFRFGIQAGGSGSYYIGSLKIPRIAADLKRGLIDVTSGDGAGYFIGAAAEYLPPSAAWGAALKINAIDIRLGNGFSEPLNIDSSLKYVSQTKVNYLTVSPELRYNLPIDGLYLIGGLDFEILTSSESKIGRQFNNIGDIVQLARDTTFAPQPFRVGGHIGLGYDIFSANLPPSLRFRITPFITAQGGSLVNSSLGSSWNSITGKAGIAFKLSFDNVTDSIIPYDPNYAEPPRYLASAQYERGITIAESPTLRKIEVLDLTVSSIEIPDEETPKIQTIVSRQPEQSETPVRNGGETIAATEIPDISNKETVGQQINSSETTPALKITPNGEIKHFSFSTSTSLNLGADARQYLDAVAEYLKANPRSVVRIVGHSDNAGGSTEQQTLSERRAQQAMEYLRRKGIAQGRIFPSAKGAREPLADNATEQGRRRNRRVDIRVEQ